MLGEFNDRHGTVGYAAFADLGPVLAGDAETAASYQLIKERHDQTPAEVQKSFATLAEPNADRSDRAQVHSQIAQQYR